MATAKELLDGGQLRAAIDQLTSEIRANPTDVSRRTFLFELLCFAGEWDRAEKQLDVIAHQDLKTEIGAQIYRQNIMAERLRHRVMTEALEPTFLIKPPDYVLLHLSAVAQMKENLFDEAAQLLERAEEERPALSGTLNDQPFADFRDAHDLVAPVLELIVQDRYTWLSFEHIRSIEIPSPIHLRDLLWVKARIETTDVAGGFAGEAFIPALYHGSSGHQNEQIKLGRMTDWQELGDQLAAPVGLRLFLVDGKDISIIETSKIEFATAAVESAPETA